MSYICIDIGGTSIKYGMLTEEGDISITGTITTRVTETKNYILEDIKKVIKDIKEEFSSIKIKGICVSSAGVIDSDKGEVAFAGPTITNYTGTKIKEEIEKEFGINCEVENDVNCAALGEYWLGAGKNSSSMVCMTVGTGIGGAVILDGKLLKGIGHTAGEIGYMNVNGSHIQEIASARTLVNNVNKRKNEIDGLNKKYSGKTIFELAKKGDKICIEEIDKLINNLSIAIQNIIYILNPEIVVIGGGITAQKEYLEEKLSNSVNSGMISDTFRKTKIVLANQGNQAGMLGALYHFLTKIKDRKRDV